MTEAQCLRCWIVSKPDVTVHGLSPPRIAAADPRLADIIQVHGDVFSLVVWARN
jgi:hypothetical protein